MIEATTATTIPTTPLRDLGWRAPVGDPGANDLDKDAFLQLLVAQLRYQDPLNPNDPAEFMATTAQFTVVEKLEELTQQGANTAIISGLSMASSLVGRTVTYIGADDAVATGVVSSAQVSNGEVRLVTDNGIVDLSTVIGIGATGAETAPEGTTDPVGTAVPAAEPDPSAPTSENSEPAPDPTPITESDDTAPGDSAPVVAPPATSDIPVVSTLPVAPLAVPPPLSSAAEQPGTPISSDPPSTDIDANSLTQPPSNTTPVSDLHTTKEFTS